MIHRINLETGDMVRVIPREGATVQLCITPRDFPSEIVRSLTVDEARKLAFALVTCAERAALKTA